MVARGEIWLAALNPTVGSEIQKTRPCLILSPYEMNQTVRTVLAAPLTSRGRPASFRVEINFQDKAGFILLDQMRSLDRSRLLKKLGTADAKTLTATLTTLQDIFAE